MVLHRLGVSVNDIFLLYWILKKLQEIYLDYWLKILVYILFSVPFLLKNPYVNSKIYHLQMR